MNALAADDQPDIDIHTGPVVGRPSPGGGARRMPTPITGSPRSREFAELRLLAESFEDVQKTRIANENRLRSGQDSGPVTEALESLTQAEKKLSLAMRQAFRRAAPEIHVWVKNTPGVGEHLMARLLGSIGHPVIASPYHWEGDGPNRVLVADPPFVRSVSQLWSYCGYGDPARRKRKGMTADEAMGLGNPRAKMILRLLAEACMKCVGGPAKHVAPPTDGSSAPTTDFGEVHRDPDAQCGCDLAETSESDGGSKVLPLPKRPSIRPRSPYRDTYERGRLVYAQRADWSLLHQHNATLRLVSKEILRDLWLTAAQ